MALHDNTLSQMVENAASAIADVARDHPFWRGRMGEDRRPVCVHAPSRAIRERVSQLADSGHIMFEFGDSLLLFLVKIAKVFGQVLEAAPDPSLTKLLDIDPWTLSQLPEPRKRLRDLLSSIAVCGHPGLAPSFETSPAVEQLASQLSTTMLFFVVSRAFVQYLSNDFSDASSIPAGLEDFEAQELFFHFEYEAWTDQLALDLMARSEKREGVPNGIFTLAPFLFLHGALAVRRTLERLEPHGRSFSESAARRAGLPTFVSERLDALADSGPNGAKLPSIIHRNGAWLGRLLESVHISSLGFIDRCRGLGLTPGSVSRADATHAFC